MKKLFSLSLAVLTAPVLLAADTYTVTSLEDSSSPGTLRWALQQANGDPGSTIAFATAGTINVGSELPVITRPTTIDGTTAPGFSGSPVVGVNFGGQNGLIVAPGADRSVIRGLALTRAGTAGLILSASGVTVDGNNIGLTTDGAPAGNGGDGIRINSESKGNLIGSLDAVTGVNYWDTTSGRNFPVQPVTAWQGLRNYEKNPAEFLICGTSDNNGLLYVGPIPGGGRSYLMKYPGATSTSVYGPDNLSNNELRMVGSYINGDNPNVYNYGFVWEGTLSDLPNGGKYRKIEYPGAEFQYTHSTMGDLAVGNADGPDGNLPIGPGIAYIYDVSKKKFVDTIEFPNAKSNTAYGIWYNGGNSYTICGGFSPVVTNNFDDPASYPEPLAQGKAYLVDYDSRTKKFSNWQSFEYQNGSRGRSFITHFEGISSVEPGVYTMNADSVNVGGGNPLQGSLVTVRRDSDGKFGRANWVDLNFPGTDGITSSNSVYGTNVVGLVIGKEALSYQARVNVGFQLSNVISGNGGNGVGIYGATDNVLAQNYIGTNPQGSEAIANKRNGVFLTAGATRNEIGGQLAGTNNPTGTKGQTKPVFIVPPQGNVISGNRQSGVLITDNSRNNQISGNFIGTNGGGNRAVGNGRDGVTIDRSNGNRLIGCTLFQNPFVFYNVISGNGRNGVHVENSDDLTIHANFIGIGANNSTLVPNGNDGLSVAGNSKNTQVGGVIPLGNVISGNTKNGIAVRDRVSGFVSFNTFGGGYAFGGAAPNGRNGVLITSTGGNNVIRTCILSGNKGNGIEISGNASGVKVVETACGTVTDIDAPLPNGGHGALIAGTAHDNVLGGFKASVEARTHFSGNLGYGVAIIESAYNNTIVSSNIGLGDVGSDGIEPAIPNQSGGVFLGEGTSATTIGGNGSPAPNKISTNVGPGLVIMASARNSVVENEVLSNTQVGIFATGACDGTVLSGNLVVGNGSGPGDNYDIDSASGLTLIP